MPWKPTQFLSILETIHTLNLMRITHLLLNRLSAPTLNIGQKQKQRPQLLLPLLSTTVTLASNVRLAQTRQHPPPSYHTSSTRHRHLSRSFSISSPPNPQRSNMDNDAAAELAARFEEQASVQQKLSSSSSPPPPKAKKTKGAGGGAGAGAGGPQKRQKDISRALSRLLRHQATNAGIQLDREGYAPLDKVVSLILASSILCSGERRNLCLGLDWSEARTVSLIINHLRVPSTAQVVG